jgi:dCMP deaminase
MELIIDNNFKQAYAFYYGDLRDGSILTAINGMFTAYDTEIVYDTINLIKTSIVLGVTYTECYDKIVETIISRFPLGADIDKFIISLVVKIMIASGSTEIADLVKTTRDIEREVAAKYFRIPPKKVTTEMINTITAASDKFVAKEYAVLDEQVDSWDEYFYSVCRQVARNSKCLSRRIGAVLVYDKSIISTGYNGPPRGVPRCDIRWRIDAAFNKKYGDLAKDKKLDGVCPRYALGFKSGEGLEICVAGHSERNALINAARLGIRTKGASLYMTCGIPCTTCLIEIINAGVKEIIVTSLKTYDESSLYLLNQSDLGIRLFSFL